MILTDELCDKLCAAAKEKSREIGIDISFAISDENGLPRVYRRYGEALVLSITLVPGKAYTAAVTQCKTKDVAAAAAEGASLMAIQTNDPRITLAGIRCLLREKLQAVLASAAGVRRRIARLRSMLFLYSTKHINCLINVKQLNISIITEPITRKIKCVDRLCDFVRRGPIC